MLRCSWRPASVVLVVDVVVVFEETTLPCTLLSRPSHHPTRYPPYSPCLLIDFDHRDRLFIRFDFGVIEVIGLSGNRYRGNFFIFHKRCDFRTILIRRSNRILLNCNKTKNCIFHEPVYIRWKNSSRLHVPFASNAYFTTTRTMFRRIKARIRMKIENNWHIFRSRSQDTSQPWRKIFIMAFKFRGQSPSYTVLDSGMGEPPRIRMKMYGKPATPGKSWRPLLASWRRGRTPEKFHASVSADAATLHVADTVLMVTKWQICGIAIFPAFSIYRISVSLLRVTEMDVKLVDYKIKKIDVPF